MAQPKHAAAKPLMLMLDEENRNMGGYQMPERLEFLEQALQGLAFWIGHRHSLFAKYPLPEGAMVAEACNLIQANLHDALDLRPECQYRNILPQEANLDDIGKLSRADLVICSSAAQAVPRNGNISEHVHFVIEVKRAAAGKAAINDDLLRLYRFLDKSPQDRRCFLIVVSESRAPTRFVSKGRSRLGPNEIPGCDGCFHVRRTVKAAASFSNKSNAHYVCLMEVFRDKPHKLPNI